MLHHVIDEELHTFKTVQHPSLEGQTHDCLAPKVLGSSEMLVAIIRPHRVLLLNIQCAIFLTI